MGDVAMPRLSDSMEEGTILKWLKSDGDEVSQGDELVEIETDKANMTYEADESGTLEIVAKEGDTLPVGETICRIGEGSSGDDEQDEPEEDEDADEDGAADEANEEDSDEPTDEEEEEASEDEEEEPEEEEEEEEDEEPEEEPEPESDDKDEERVKASPIARRMAEEAGIDLSSIEGSGPGGRIVKADVESAGGEAPEQDKEETPKESRGKEGRGDTERQELNRLQRTVARRMAESKATAPDFVITVEVDMEEAVALRAQLKAAAGDQPAPSFNDFVIKASALALKDFPRANGAYRDGQFELYSRVNVGVAVAGQDALVVPTVFDADEKSLGQIAADARKLAERVREGKITPPELSAGTFTVSNLGMYGIRRFVAVLNPPQAAILAVGELTPRPVVRDGEVVVRTVSELTLTCDHRILYGADAAEFLGRIRAYLEQPLKLVL